jgi:hypothetical protein
MFRTSEIDAMKSIANGRRLLPDAPANPRKARRAKPMPEPAPQHQPTQTTRDILDGYLLHMRRAKEIRERALREITRAEDAFADAENHLLDHLIKTLGLPAEDESEGGGIAGVVVGDHFLHWANVTISGGTVIERLRVNKVLGRFAPENPGGGR